MNPGRELDALVAEKVMGMELRGPRPADPLEFPLKPGAVFSPVAVQEPPPYSTDIAAAWEVFEKLKFTFVARFNGGWFSGDNAAVGDCDDPEIWLEGFKGEIKGVSAAHAICLAALKAVGE